MPQEKPKKKLTKQEQNLIDATQMKNMRPVFKRSDTPLAPSLTPKPNNNAGSKTTKKTR
jgi:hypothetical protein